MEFAHDDGFWNCECPVCGKKFHLKPSKLKADKNHYCSRKCHYEAKKEYMKGVNNHQFGLKGTLNASWKNEDRKIRHGYVVKRCIGHPFADKHGFILEHRLVAEQYLLNDENSIEIDGKRYLRPDYEVHHKDFDPVNNNVQNLEVLTKNEHKRKHSKLNPSERDVQTGKFAKRTSSVRIKKVTDTAILPKQATDGSAGFDLYADTDEEIVIPPQSTVYIRSGLAFEIPKLHVGLIFARSGLSVKKGLRPSTCVSVIDSDYRGEVGLPMYNDSTEEQRIAPHERVAQLLLQEIIIPEWVLVDSLEDTDRGENGFGSTGK